MTEARPPRALVLTLALTGALTNAEAAGRLGLSVRQVRRLKGALARAGAAGLVHGNRGRPSPRRLPDDLRERIVELARTRYLGYDQVRLCALLAEREGIVVTRSTLRRVLLAAGLRGGRRGRPPRLPAATVPIALDLTARRVTLLDLQGADFRELSLPQTLERWRRERPDALRFDLDLEVFLAVARAEAGRPPDGFLFSVGPYDGMLLSSMLTVPDQHLVVKESPVVNALLMALFGAAGQARRPDLEALATVVLPALFRPTRGTERYLLFKLSSWNLRAAEALLRLFPTTPAVVVLRSAPETVATLLARPPGWQNLLRSARPAQVRFFPSLAAVPPGVPLSPAAFYAHTWRSGLEQALGLPGERVLLLEHAALSAQPAASLERVLRHFRLAPDPATVAAMLATRPPAAREPTPLDPRQAADVRAVIGDLPARLANLARS